MSIQSNINQSLSVAGFLFQQGIGKDLAAKRTAEKDITKAQNLINRQEELFDKRYEKWKSQEPEPDINDPEDKAWKEWKEKEPDYETDLGLTAAYQQYDEILEKHQGAYPEFGVEAKRNRLAYQKAREEKIAAGRPTPVDPTQEARDTVDELIEKYVPSPADQMADRAATRLAEEQTRLRGENKIDRRKIHRESLREKGRIRANKKTGGITNV